MIKFIYSAVFALALALAGCASAPFDTSHCSKPSEGRAGVYVFRGPAWGVFQLKDVPFSLDGEERARLGISEYTYFEAEPGSHRHRSQTFPSTDVQKVDFQAGQNYFFLTGRTSPPFQSEWAFRITSRVIVDQHMGYLTRGDYERSDLD